MKLILLSILFFIGCVTEPEVEGCIDNSACNYDLNATKDDGSCTYAEINYDCEGNCFDGYTELNWYDGACYCPAPTSLSPTLLYNPITTKLPLGDVIDPFAYIR
jgi:hypothetical protein